MKAISYFTSSDARQGKYGRRPNVEIPEKTESAFQCQLLSSTWGWNKLVYLGSAITRKCVVPEGLVWALNWDLALMVTMCKCTGGQERDGDGVSQHGSGRAIN
jgi:hypothetical protein